MVFVDLPAGRVGALSDFMATQGIQILGYQPRLRLVTHLDVSMAAIERTIAAFRQFFRS
jgi:threonine aldolase